MNARAFSAPPLANLERLPILDPEYKHNPYPWYREWTARPPFWAQLEGTPVVLAARFRDVEAIYHDHQTFSSVKPPGPDMERFDFFNGYKDMVHTDPPEHTRLRGTIAAAFYPQAIARIEPQVQAVADELVRGIVQRGGPAELMTDLAHPLSVRSLLSILLAMPEQDHPLFINLSKAMGLVSETPPGGPKPKAYLDAWEAGRSYCLRLIEQRRANPGEDLVGHVIRAHLDGLLSADELFVMMIGLFAGGIGSVATTIGNASIQLLSRPEQYQALCADPGLAGNAVEEVMRFDAAGLFNYKFATRDCVFEGVEIPAGTTVYLIHQGTGFDAAVFDDPFCFDIRRSVKRHLSFGYGVHFCIGAPLARVAIKAALRAMATQMPGLKLQPGKDITYGGWQQERAPTAVHVTIS